MTDSFKRTTARNFYTAFSILLAFKLGLIADNFAAAGWKLIFKIPLLLGADVFGAFVLALLATVLETFARRTGRRGLGAAVAIGLQALHGLLAGVSFYATRYAGGPLNKEVIDLATLQGPSAGGSGTPALLSSVQHYVDVGSMTVFGLTVLFAVLSYRVLPRRLAFISSRVRRALGYVLALGALVTLFVLPWLINGHMGGIRIHTYGLERSPAVDLAWSYVKPLGRAFAGRTATGAESFVFEMGSEEDPDAVQRTPLNGVTPRPANVVYISLESVAAPYIQDDPTRMPYLTSIGRTNPGVRFDAHYAVWPQTMKAFFSIFCSELPYPYYQPITMTNPSIPCESLTETLKKHGYFNGLITSADLAYDRKMRFFKHRAFDLTLDKNNMPGREDVWSDSWGLDERLSVKTILDTAEAHQDEPFFIFYEMLTAHHPYNACREHVDNPMPDEFQAYLRALKFIDDRIRELVEGIEQLGLLENTLIVVASDHGEGFGQHPGSKSHGSKVYQENIHVPAALLGGPLGSLRGSVDFPTSHIDLAPTILGLLGLDVPCTMKGRNLMEDSPARLVYFGGRPPGGQLGLVDGRWKYIIEESGLEMLYDVQVDSLEKNDLAGEHPELLERYRRRVDGWVRHSEHLIENYSSMRRAGDCI